MDTIQERMDDPNYKATGQTYGHLRDNSFSFSAVWNRAVAQERDRCAKIAEEWNEGHGHTGHDIAAAIRRGE